MTGLLPTIRVIPAKAGIQLCHAASNPAWIPAFAGMTAKVNSREEVA